VKTAAYRPALEELVATRPKVAAPQMKSDSVPQTQQ
jgi:hypothetical protein